MESMPGAIAGSHRKEGRGGKQLTKRHVSRLKRKQTISRARGYRIQAKEKRKPHLSLLGLGPQKKQRRVPKKEKRRRLQKFSKRGGKIRLT